MWLIYRSPPSPPLTLTPPPLTSRRSPHPDLTVPLLSSVTFLPFSPLLSPSPPSLDGLVRQLGSKFTLSSFLPFPFHLVHSSVSFRILSLSCYSPTVSFFPFLHPPLFITTFFIPLLSHLYSIVTFPSSSSSPSFVLLPLCLHPLPFFLPLLSSPLFTKLVHPHLSRKTPPFDPPPPLTLQPISAMQKM